MRGKGKAEINSAILIGTPARARKSPNNDIPITMKNIIQTERTVSRQAIQISCKLPCLRTRAATRVPNAPTDPASVGVAHPIYILPMTRVNMSTIPQILLNDFNLSFQENPAAIGAKSGDRFTVSTIKLIKMSAERIPGRIPAINILLTDSCVTDA